MADAGELGLAPAQQQQQQQQQRRQSQRWANAGELAFTTKPATFEDSHGASSGLAGSMPSVSGAAEQTDGRTALSRSAVSHAPSTSSMGSMNGAREKGRRDVAVYAGNGRFQFQSKIGAGAFGQVYQGLDLATQRAVAIKLEKKGQNRPQLDVELKLYKLLNKTPRPGVPRIYYYGCEGPFHVLVMELLGPSLEDLMTYCRRRMSLKTTLLLGEQMVGLLENIHSEGFIHRDIKPENFAMGIGEKGHILYLIDFGLAKRYMDRSGEHIRFRSDKGFTGTARYASLGTHLGNEQSRRDDVESFLYVLIFFLKGELPWQGVRAADRAMKKKLIQEKKSAIPPEELCQDLPAVFLKIAHHVRSLGFEDRPDYDQLRQWLQEELVLQGFERDWLYDWLDYLEDNRRRQSRSAGGSGYSSSGIGVSGGGKWRGMQGSGQAAQAPLGGHQVVAEELNGHA